MKTKNKLMFTLILFFGGILLFQSCRKDDETVVNNDSPVVVQQDLAKVNPHEDNLVVKPWYDLLNDLIKTTPGHTPPIAAREIAYTSIALYEATTGGVNGYKSLGNQLQGLGSIPLRTKLLYVGPVAANAAFARIIAKLVGNASATGLASISALEAQFDAAFAIKYAAADIARSQQFGRDIADIIFAYSQTDGADAAYLDVFPASYVTPVGPGLWEPTSAQLIPMLPYWGSIRTFVAANSSPLIDPPPPPTYDPTVGSPYYNAALNVYTTVNNLTLVQKDIASFWADGSGTYTAPGHLIAITAQICTDRNLYLSKTAFILAKEAITLSDAGVVCWRAQYNNNLLRPVTFINSNIDGAWATYIPTPPFPTYTSGHSTFSGGTSAILFKEFGCKPFTDYTKVKLGFPPRPYSCVKVALQEAAVSRLYAGINYEFDNVNGFNCGIAVANNVTTIIRWR